MYLIVKQYIVFTSFSYYWEYSESKVNRKASIMNRIVTRVYWCTTSSVSFETFERYLLLKKSAIQKNINYVTSIQLLILRFNNTTVDYFTHSDAVCVCVCDQVMAIAPSHFIWQRERAAHHSGAQRQYREEVLIPRGPAASPEPCALCAKALLLSPSPLPLTLSLSLQETPKSQKLVQPCSKASCYCTHSPAGER